VTAGGQHSSNLAIPSLIEHHLQNRAGLVGGPQDHTLRLHPSIREMHAAAEGVERVLRRHARDLHEVGLFHAVAGVCKVIGEVTVVGDQDQARAGAVKPSDGKQTPIAGEQVDDARPS